MAIGDPKVEKAMKEELAALKKKRDAGKLTAFKYRQGVTKIKEKYGKAPPSTASKVMTYISTKSPLDAVRDFAPKLLEISPRSAKAVAAKKAAGLANRGKSQGGRTAAEDKKARPATKKDNFLAGLDLTKKKKRAAPKFNPSGLKVPAKKKAAAKKEKLYDTINPKTGKLTNKKVSAKQHLKNIDMNKARIKKEAQEKIDRNLKVAVKKSMKKKKRG